MTRIAGLASNRGRSLLHVADLAPGGAAVAAVLADDAGAPVLDGAKRRDVPTEVVEPREGESRHDYGRRVVEALEPHDPDLVCLDGYRPELPADALDRLPTALAVRPSLAADGGATPEDALAAGARVTGATVHVVAPDDGAGDGTGAGAGAGAGDGIGAASVGPVVTQEPVPVFEDDTPEAVEERVVTRGAFRAYPRAVRWFAEGRLQGAAVEGDEGGDLPARYLEGADRVRGLRYGENPHQDAAVYADYACPEASVVRGDQLNEGARALSYNNYNDADAALNLVREFDEPAAAVIKHTNPAGCAVADTIAAAYDDALATDPKSAFGGIVGLNRECDAATAEAVTDSFKEVVVAPGYTDAALAVLREEENLRVLDVGPAGAAAAGGRPLGEVTQRTAEKHLVGGRLVQERDLQSLSRADLEVVTGREPTDRQVGTMLFAWQVVKHVKSNAIVFADGTETVGIGAGQVSRVDAVEIAATKADRDAEGKSADGAVMASDAFFPFPDGVEKAAEAGVEAVIQPGGSVNDEDVIEACDDLGLAMAFTGRRAFRHD